MSYQGWLLFFSSLPSKPVAHRIKVWRTLVKSGAVHLKGSVYVLPQSPEHVGLLERLVREIDGKGGEAAYARVERIETIPDAEIVSLFRQRKESDYRELAKALDSAERRIQGVRQGGDPPAVKGLAAQFAKINRSFDEARRTDFFAAESGAAIEARLAQLSTALHALQGSRDGAGAGAGITPRSVAAYQRQRWLTGRNPWADRMATAWLIRKFIDPAAAFGFFDETEAPPPAAESVLFGVAGGDFAHSGDLCTFEVFVRSFDLKDPALAKMVGIVRTIELRDGRCQAVEAPGVEEIISGSLRIAHDDAEALERGIAVFEMLYAAKSR